MRNHMYFKDGSNADLNVVVTELPPIPVAEENGEWVQLRGVDGERFVPDGGLGSVPLTVPLWIPPTADINAVTAWLTGRGKLRFNAWPWYWDARIDGVTTLMPCVFNDGWTTTATFKARPHRYLWPEAAPVVFTDIGGITNPGTADALPLIEVEGSGDVTLMIGSYSVLIDDMSGAITMDCEAKAAYSESDAHVMDQITLADGLWPVLKPGTNMINWAGDVTRVTITPRWRYR